MSQSKSIVQGQCLTQGISQENARNRPRSRVRAGALLALLLAFLVPAARASIYDFRITEVDPYHQKIEVTYFGTIPFFMTNEIPVPYNFDLNNFKMMGIVPGFNFNPNTIMVIDIPDMYTYAGDCWLYNGYGYESPNAVIHGVQYGTPPPEKTNSEVAAQAVPPKWPKKSASAPVPPQGCTLAYDGDGFSNLDWYICYKPTMGYPNTTVSGSVPDKTFFGINASQNFETAPLGDQVNALANWSVSGAGRSFNVRFVSDVNGTAGPRPGSTSQKWLRIRDTDPDGDNSFASPAVAIDGQYGYNFSFYVNQEIAPTATGTQPTLVIQNDDGAGGWSDAWGVRFTSNGIEATVLDAGGAPDSAGLTYLGDSTGIGQWVRIDLKLDLTNGMMYASVNGLSPTRLPVAPTGNPLRLRLAYQGGGSGNTQDMLLDDVSLTPYYPIHNGIKAWEAYK